MVNIDNIKDKLDFLESSLKEDTVSFNLLNDNQKLLLNHTKLELERLNHEIKFTYKRLEILKENVRTCIKSLRRTSPKTSIPYLENKMEHLKIDKAITRDDFRKILQN